MGSRHYSTWALSRQGEIQKIAEEVRKCRKCSLWQTRRNAVAGEGNLNSPIVLIGEAPGYWEDVRGKPFVGAAGKILDEILERINLPRTKIFITNILKCRPPKNRDPRAAEVKVCASYLDRQIELIKPSLIVTLGRHSTAYVFSRMGMKSEGITKVRGQIFSSDFLDSKVCVLPTFHPAAALYNAQLREDIEHDFQVLKSELERLEELG